MMTLCGQSGAGMLDLHRWAFPLHAVVVRGQAAARAVDDQQGGEAQRGGAQACAARRRAERSTLPDGNHGENNR
ncbi:hypothetical protein [Pseudorhodoferax sp.]|uniref:hypothetical protein n=1 Tax=Pseudorhodoferax sp. TaxID=1993553 RepID=UPI0039E6194D